MISDSFVFEDSISALGLDSIPAVFVEIDFLSFVARVSYLFMDPDEKGMSRLECRHDHDANRE